MELGMLNERACILMRLPELLILTCTGSVKFSMLRKTTSFDDIIDECAAVLQRDRGNIQ